MQSVGISSSAPGTDARPRLKAIVTDLDGTLCDTETVLVSAINRFLAAENQAPVTHDEAHTMTGLDNDSWWRRISQMRPTLSTPLEEYTHRVDMIARALFPTELVVADGAMELIAGIRQSGVPFALATSAQREWAIQRLQIMGIVDAFDAIVTRDMVSAPKPDPEIYREAARRLGVHPGETLAIEDSPSGIRAARDAGMYTIAVRTQWMQDIDQSYAHAIVGSLRQIDLTVLGLSTTATEEDSPQ